MLDGRDSSAGSAATTKQTTQTTRSARNRRYKAARKRRSGPMLMTQSACRRSSLPSVRLALFAKWADNSPGLPWLFGTGGHGGRRRLRHWLLAREADGISNAVDASVLLRSDGPARR